MQYFSRRALPSVLALLGRSSLSALLILTLLSIVVPGVAHASSGYGGCALTHRVSAGETLTWIAARYGLSVDELARMNQLDDLDYIYEDQELCVPGDRYRGFEKNGYDNGGFDNDNRYRGFEENGYGNGGFDNDNRYRGFEKNGYDNGGFDNGNGYRGFGENGFDNGEHGRDPRIYGSAEWSDGNGNGKNDFDNGNGYRGYGDNGYGRGSYGKPYDGPGYGGD